MGRIVKTVDDTRSRLSSAVMAYLSNEYHKSKNKHSEPEDEKKPSAVEPYMEWTKKSSDSDSPVVAKVGTNEEPKLRVSNLLSKAANNSSNKPEDKKDHKEGVDYVTTEAGYREPVTTPLREVVRNWQGFWKTPILSSLAMGALPAAAYFGISKFTNPDDPEEVNVKVLANELVSEDMKNNVPLKDAQHYIDLALEKQKTSRWRKALGIGLGSAALLHLQHINPKNWSQLYKYPKVLPKKLPTEGVRHTASMLGSDPYRTADDLRASILFDTNMTPEMKYNALGVINYAPTNHMTSTDIVSNAINSGISGATGLPMGRIITSAAVDAGIGYGLGKLFGVSRPGRVAGLLGAGSALVNALQYVSNNK